MLVAQRFLDTRFRLARAFFIPEEAGREFEADIDLSSIATISITDERLPA